MVKFLELRHGQECIAWSCLGTLNNGRGYGQPSLDRWEITRGSWWWPLQGHVITVKAGYRANHWRAIETSVKEWCSCGRTKRQDSTNHPRSVINPFIPALATQQTTCRASLSATLQWPQSHTSSQLHPSPPAMLACQPLYTLTANPQANYMPHHLPC